MSPLGGGGRQGSAPADPDFSEPAPGGSFGSPPITPFGGGGGSQLNPGPGNLPPQGFPESYCTPRDQILSTIANESPFGVLHNDVDPEGQPLTAVLVQGTTFGTLTFSSDGSFDYLPDAGFIGQDHFVYSPFDKELSGAPGTVDINVDGPEVSVAATVSSVAENSALSAEFTFTRTGDLDADLSVYFTLSGNASQGTDYFEQSGFVVIAAESASATVAITPLDDNFAEGDESVIATIFPHSTYFPSSSTTASVTIVDDPEDTDPVVSIGATDPFAKEDATNPGAFTISRTGGLSNPLAVSYLIAGSAENGVDYSSISEIAVIPANEPSVEVVIQPATDGYLEGVEHVQLYLFDNGSYEIGNDSSATVLIEDADGDSVPVVTVTAHVPEAQEANLDDGNVVPGEFRVYRTGALELPLAVSYQLTGVAIQGVDYESLSGEVIIPSWEDEAAIVVTPINDNVAENSETVIATIAPSSGYEPGSADSATVHITDGMLDSIPIVTVAASRPDAMEDDPNHPGMPIPGEFTLERSGPINVNLWVNYALAGTADVGLDFSPLSAAILIPSGQASITVALTPILDQLVEPTETVQISLQPSVAYLVGEENQAVVNIDDAPPPGPINSIEAFVPSTPPRNPAQATPWPNPVNLSFRSTTRLPQAGGLVFNEADFAAGRALVLFMNSVPEVLLEVAPNNANVTFEVRRNPQDMNLLGTSVPTVQNIQGNRAALVPNQTGSFFILAFVDNTGDRQWTPGEPGVRMPLILVSGRLLEDYSRSNRAMRFTGPVLNSFAVRAGIATALGQGGVEFEAEVRLTGGGPAGQLGLDRAFVGWSNNFTGVNYVGHYVDPNNANNTSRVSRIHVTNGAAADIQFLGSGVFTTVQPSQLTLPLLDAGGIGITFSTTTDDASNILTGQMRTVRAADAPTWRYPQVHWRTSHQLSSITHNLTSRTYLVGWTNVSADRGAQEAGSRTFVVFSQHEWTVTATAQVQGMNIAGNGVIAMGPNTILTITPARQTQLEVRPPLTTETSAYDARN